VAIEIRDPDGQPLPDGAEGEVHVRSPLVMRGYWRNPAATAAVLAPDGWLRTGDLGRIEGGRLYLASRRHDLILRGGENVYPVEIEDVLHAHPAVAEAAVVGVPDERWGEAAVAFVALRAGVSVTEEELVEHCRARLATFKVPRSVRLVGALPRSALGKVRKDELRLLATERQEVGS
jgi:acyl-CoA synthetase (AMP-forming)/AMP-acid ligase II